MGEDPTFGASMWAANVRALVDAMLLLVKNEVLPYAQMSALIGKDVDGGTSEYQVARNRLSKHYHIEMKTLPKIGAMRLDDGGIVEELPRDRDGIHRKIKRSLQRTANVEDYDVLSNTQKLEHDRHLAHLGLMRALQEPAASRAIDERVTYGLREVDYQRLIELLRS